MPVDEEEFLKKVDFEISAGEIKKLISLKKIATKRDFEIARVKLTKAIENLRGVKSIQEQASLISEDKKRIILDKYLKEGVSLNKLAISYRIKKPLIIEIIEKNFPEMNQKRIHSISM